MNISDIKFSINRMRLKAWNWIFPIVAKTSAYTVVSPADNGKCFTNGGASGSVTFTLPASKEGLRFTFTKAVINQNIVIAPASPAAIRGKTGTGTTAMTNSTNTEHGSVTLYGDGTNWYSLCEVGTWTIS